MNQKSLKIAFTFWLFGLAVAFVAVAFYVFRFDAGMAIPKPDAETLRLVQPLLAHRITPDDRKTLAKFYVEFAEVVQNDSREVLKTNLEFRNCNRASCSVFFQRTGIGQRYAGIENSVDDVLANAIGGERDTNGNWSAVEIDKNTRARLSATLSGVAWAFYHGGNG